MVYVSVRGRVWLQVEAANMVESIGNYVKHRRVPVVSKEGGKYLTFFVPSISGESIAHAYQVLLAEELKKQGVKVCNYCGKGIFLKSTNKELYKEVTGKEPPKAEGKSEKKTSLMDSVEEIERNIVTNCGVEDIGGFLYAEKPNVKRTSSFLTGYMVPVSEALKAMSIEPQLHSRYALGTRFISVEEGAAGQMIYYVEVSSAVFTFAFDLDTKFIGRYTFHVDNYGKEIITPEEISRRTQASLYALKRLLIEFPVGAKRTRFNPADVRWESIGIAISNDVWTMPSSFTKDYLERAYVKLSKIDYETQIYAYAEEKILVSEQTSGAKVKYYNTPEEAIIDAISNAEERMG